MNILIETSDIIRWIVFLILAVPAVWGSCSMRCGSRTPEPNKPSVAPVPFPSYLACLVAWPWWRAPHPIPPFLLGSSPCRCEHSRATLVLDGGQEKA